MGILDFKYQKTVGEALSKEQLSEKITDALRNNAYDVSENNGEIVVKGLKSYFNSGCAVIKVNDAAVTVEGKVMPSIAAFICMGLSVIFDCIGLFGECDMSMVLVMALVISLGAAGTIGSIITLLFGKELLRQNLALLICSAGK